VFRQDLALKLLQFGAVHTCRIMPPLTKEVAARMGAKRLAELEEGRVLAKAAIGRKVSSLLPLISE
jgi:hypothetical protein